MSKINDWIDSNEEFDGHTGCDVMVIPLDVIPELIELVRQEEREMVVEELTSLKDNADLHVNFDNGDQETVITTGDIESLIDELSPTK